MADGFGDNVAAKAAKETTYYINTVDGTVSSCGGGVNESSSSSLAENLLTITSTVGSFQLTQGSRLTAKAIATTELYGTVIDWGCGGGVLALLAASQSKVDRVIGLDYELQNIETCLQNARQNGLANKTEFYRSDSFHLFDDTTTTTTATTAAAAAKKVIMSNLKGQIDFVISNPPASTNDDGFSFRRRILKEAIPFLKPNGQIFLQALSYYGPQRFVQAAKEATNLWNNIKNNNNNNTNNDMEYKYLGVIQSSKWMELGTGPGGYDFRAQLKQYCHEEERQGGMRYYCGYRRGEQSPDEEEQQLTAVEAMSLWETQEKTPLCQWHVHALQWKCKINK